MVNTLKILYKNQLAQENISFESGFFTKNNSSEKSSYYKITPSTPSKGLIIYSHGTGDDGLFPQLSLFKTLALDGFEVFSYDLDGHGQKSTTYLSRHSVKESLHEALNFATKGRKDESVHLIGNSLGAALSLYEASCDRHRIKSLSLISIPVFLPHRYSLLLKEFLGFFSKTAQRNIKLYGLYNFLPAFGNFKRSNYPIRLETQEKKSLGYITVIQKILDSLDLKNASTKTSVPTLFCSGDKDFITPIKYAKELSEATPHAKLSAIKDATHFTTLLHSKTESKILEHINKTNQSTYLN